MNTADWKIIKPARGSSMRFRKYDNSCVVIVSGEKYPKIYLTHKVDVLLGHPRRLVVKVSPKEDIALVVPPSGAKNSLSFPVTDCPPSADASTYHRSIAGELVCAQLKLARGVYDATFRDSPEPSVVFYPLTGLIEEFD